MTAIFATIGAVFGYMAGHTQNEALLYKNEAAIRRTEASDQWNFYQAKSSKQNLAELGATLTTGEQQTRYQKEVDRYKLEKEEIMPKAKKLEDQSSEAEQKSEASMHIHHRWAQAMTLIQIAIALAAITILTRNRRLQYLAYAGAAISIALGALAVVHI
jgi:Na+/glutamate symporter